MRKFRSRWNSAAEGAVNTDGSAEAEEPNVSEEVVVVEGVVEAVSAGEAKPYEALALIVGLSVTASEHSPKPNRGQSFACMNEGGTKSK